MNIGILSGKGGTGKTMISVNLAAVQKDSIYLDFDVEEPNGHLFFKLYQITQENVTVKMPLIDEKLCNGCKACVDFCNFNALAYANHKLMVFEDICHSCGGCSIVCPTLAISEKDKIIGNIEKGESQGVEVLTGIMNLGHPSGVPIVKKLGNTLKNSNKIAFLDCPPGASCLVMESMKHADYCVIVAEPSIFGAHNLEMVYELALLLKKPFGVILNKSLEGVNPSKEFCEKNQVKIIGEIPYDEKLADINSRGLILARENEYYNQLFSSLLENILKEVSDEATFNS